MLWVTDTNNICEPEDLLEELEYWFALPKGFYTKEEWTRYVTTKTKLQRIIDAASIRDS